MAFLLLKELGSPGLATRLATASPSPGSQKAADTLMASAAPADQTEVPVKIAASATSPASLRSGWAYIGHYMASEGKWRTRYFVFPGEPGPHSFTGQVLTVSEKTGDLNVRGDMPSPQAQFAKIIDVLKPGSQVTIQEVREWQSSGYWWARISYGQR